MFGMLALQACLENCKAHINPYEWMQDMGKTLSLVADSGFVRTQSYPPQRQEVEQLQLWR